MKRFLKLLAAFGLIEGFLYLNQQWLQLSTYRIRVNKLPSELEGLRIVQISDLHHARFGKNQRHLIDHVNGQNPDIIFITGDLVDRFFFNEVRGLNTVKSLLDIAPVYLITGNHEELIEGWFDLRDHLKEMGVHILANHYELFQHNGKYLQIAGIEDPAGGKDPEVMLDNALAGIDYSLPILLLAHRPEHHKLYAERGVDVTFNGHAHGGIIRIPFIGGLIDHSYRLFPSRVEGVHKTGNMIQVISRGLGNSGSMFRLFNRPEIVVIELLS